MMKQLLKQFYSDMSSSGSTALLYGCCLIFVLSFSSKPTRAQSNSDSAYAMPLSDVLADIQQRYHIRLRYDSSLIEGKQLSYARWRYRPDIVQTLAGVLAPFDLKAKPDGGPDKYKIGTYEYYRWPVEEGWAELERIAAGYNSLEQWEDRRRLLRPQLMEALGLSRLPARPSARPIRTPQRRYRDYTVENIAVELLPGLWVNGSLYRPAKYKGRMPVILNPDGHWPKQRYRPDCQTRCAAFARMGAMAFSYDLFAWGESLLQFKSEDHRRSLAQTIQVLGALRILDYLLSLPEADTSRVAMTGGSGGGSHTVLMTAIDDRIKVSAPVVSVSSYMYGGCPCESGMPIHFCGGGTNNVELAAMAAPRPQLLVSDGGDWTDRMPEHDFPYLKKIYGWYGNGAAVENRHLPDEGHDFGINKRKAVYRFMARHLGLDLAAISDASGAIDEHGITIEPEQRLYVFGDHGERLPARAIKGFDQLEALFKKAVQAQ